MIRRKLRTQDSGPGFPVWMVTFSDMVTLLMTFFVMLVSMASMTDVYKRKVALGSVSGIFGTGATRLDDLTTVRAPGMVEPGPINLFKDLEPMRQRLWDRPESDLHFESNRFIQRLSMDADTLFAPGSAELTSEGRALLERVRPFVADSAYPLGLSGHTGHGRDELGDSFQARVGSKLDFSWRLSLDRVMNVYRYFVDSGVAPDKLRLEAFGQFRPKAANESPEGRKANRRVDITLDKRIGSWSPDLVSRQVEAANGTKKEFSVDDFLFRFELPGGR